MLRFSKHERIFSHVGCLCGEYFSTEWRTNQKKWYIESMSTMISEVYDALKEAGASEEKARKAAEAVASYENRFARIEGDLGVVKWMLGFNLAMTVAVLWKVFSA